MSQVMYSAPSILAAPLARRGAAVAHWQPGAVKRHWKLIQVSAPPVPPALLNCIYPDPCQWRAPLIMTVAKE